MVSNGRSDRDRTEHGNYAVEYSLEDVLSVFDPSEPMTSREVAEEIGSTRKTAYAKLTLLDDQGELQTKKIAGRIRLWWTEG